ncbi:hypothetical protein MD484_g575, partial [Candolleomyces efflorescens]
MATFLFGPTTCERCGSAWGNLHFGISMKLCENCSVWVLIDEAYAWELCEAHKHFVDPREALRLCQRALSSGKLGVYFMRHKRELVYVTLTEEDVLEAIRLACFTCYKAANGTHSQDQWLLMKNQRLSLVESRNKHITRCQSWLDGLFADNKAFEMRWFAKRIKQYYSKSGHDKIDIDLVDPETDPVHTLKLCYMLGLSKHDLRAYLQRLDRRMPLMRGWRLQEDRQCLIRDAYQNYKRDLSYSDWKHLPYQLDWESQEAFRPFLSYELLGDVNRPDDGFTPQMAHENFPSALRVWREGMVRELRLQISRAIGREESDLPDNVLDLASSVFICGNCSMGISGQRDKLAIYAGLDSILLHHASRPCLSRSMVCCPIGREAAVSLAQCLKLDPETTTAKELDDLDARFFCAAHQGEDRSCSHKGKRKALTWRECIDHATEIDVEFVPKWHLLTKYATRIVRSREPQWPKLDDAVWGCTHCGEHSSTAATWSTHVTEKHGLSNPKRECDIVHLLDRSGTPRREPIVYPFGNNASICLLCLRGDSNAVTPFSVYKQLQRHLRVSHGVTKPVKGRCWDLVKAYEGVTEEQPDSGGQSPVGSRGIE